jgi:ABC-type Mn2+/Zn2+ transport system ATPase subunit
MTFAPAGRRRGAGHEELDGAALRARGLTVAYGPVPALEDVDLAVPPGSAVAVLGPNGSGKSTLFSAVVGLVAPARGTVDVGGRRVAYLPQHLDVDPTFPITVRDVVAMGRWGELGWLRRPRAHDRRLVAEALDALGIADLAGRRLGELSGGQRQRALVAQALVQRADVLLLDEPFTGVDRPTETVIRELLRRWRDEGRTLLVATHDLERAATDYDLVLALNRRAVAFGPPAQACTEPVLRATFGGEVARLGAGITLGHHDC